MDSYVNRLTTIFYTFVTAFGFASILNHFSAYVCFYPKPTGIISNIVLHDFTVNSFLGQEQANLSFDFEADLTSEFHWNQKQLFLYVLVKYETETSHLNEVIIWDEILRDKEEAKFSLQGLEAKYPLRDQFKELKKKQAKLVVRYRRMPIIGMMDESDFIESEPLEMPDRYFRK
ncbi:unnamed protein product [Amoebophrya sp. A120]|nr:unnamed protein product [Amoebophrya sp. A120]|eukprot:GSA120T00022850001.1